MDINGCYTSDLINYKRPYPEHQGTTGLQLSLEGSLTMIWTFVLIFNFEMIMSIARPMMLFLEIYFLAMVGRYLLISFIEG
jgi:hypothetical protein